MAEVTERAAGGRRRAAWDTLPANRIVLMGEAAAAMGIKRETLVNEYAGGRRPMPANVEVIRDGKRAVGLRRNV